jgi:hypothetical protein
MVRLLTHPSREMAAPISEPAVGSGTTAVPGNPECATVACAFGRGANLPRTKILTNRAVNLDVDACGFPLCLAQS